MIRRFWKEKKRASDVPPATGRVVYEFDLGEFSFRVRPLDDKSKNVYTLIGLHCQVYLEEPKILTQYVVDVNLKAFLDKTRFLELGSKGKFVGQIGRLKLRRRVKELRRISLELAAGIDAHEN